MAAYEDSYKSQLQGVSQQVPRERLDGQVSSQINMVSDAVTGLRKRPGAQVAWQLTAGAEDQPDAYVGMETVVGAVDCQVLVDAKKGIVRVYGADDTLLYTSAEIPYLQTTASTVSPDLADAGLLQFANLNGELFMLNTQKIPEAGAPTDVVQTAKSYVWITAGAFNTKYTVYVTTVEPVGFPPDYVEVTHALSYTTPDGAAPGDADLSTPEYIASNLASQIDALTYFAAEVLGSVIYVYEGGGSVSTPIGSNYMTSTIKGTIRQESNLPPTAPAAMDGFIVTVGSSRAKRYYKYRSSTSEWLEVGDAASPLTLTNMPISLTNVGGVWAVDETPYEGRLAGDDESNPIPQFVGGGLTGIGSYQGRLVLLANDKCHLSASLLPRRFFRSTVIELLDSDTIGIGSTGTTAAKFKYAIGYNNDLVLFSDTQQAILPGGAVAVTPRTAALLPTSSYATDLNMKPLEVGRGLIFATPVSAQHFGFMEMQPSVSADHQYTSDDITQHLPTYMPGRCRFGLSSTVSGMAVFGSSDMRNSLFVHEYIWIGTEKKQQAWHRWDFEYPVATAYYSGSAIRAVLRAGTQLIACTISPNGTRDLDSGGLASFLDMQASATVADSIVSMPAWFNLAVADADRAKVYFTVESGALAGSRVQCVYSAGEFTTGPSFTEGEVRFGFPYHAEVEPTPPMRKDDQGVRVSTNKMTILRFNIGTNRSGPFTVAVSDNVPGEYEDLMSPVLYNSPELVLGTPALGADNTVVVPARTRAEHTVLNISSDTESEFNLVSLEFTAQYHEKLKRMQHR